jgi:hypothetical protein
MSQSTAPESQADAGRLEAAADEAIAVCGGDVRAVLKAMIVANEFLESEVSELMKAVSRAYVRGDFKPIPADRNEHHDVRRAAATPSVFWN